MQQSYQHRKTRNSCIGRLALAPATFAFLALATAIPARADIVQLSSLSQVGGFTALYSPTEFAVFPSPYTLATPVNTLRFTQSGSFVRLNQGTGWGGNFAPGTRLLYTGNNAALGSGPVEISFSLPVFAFGLLVQNEEPGASAFTFTAFRGDTALATFNVGGDGLPSFVGARATGGDIITRFSLSSSSSVPGASNNFAMGPITFQTIPEPSTALLLSPALVGTIVGLRRRRRRLAQ